MEVNGSEETEQSQGRREGEESEGVGGGYLAAEIGLWNLLSYKDRDRIEAQLDIRAVD